MGHEKCHTTVKKPKLSLFWLGRHVPYDVK
jgi:hypothetical protein